MQIGDRISRNEYLKLSDEEKNNFRIEIYDESYKHGGYEDVDLFLRFKEAGKRLIMTPKVAYWHEEGATRFSEEEKGRQAGAEVGNLQYFLDKWKFKPHHNILQFMVDNRINL
jgi:GT2 family glycosyltransferase